MAGKAVIIQDRTDVTVVLNHTAGGKRLVGEVRVGKYKTDQKNLVRPG